MTFDYLQSVIDFQGQVEEAPKVFRPQRLSLTQRRGWDGAAVPSGSSLVSVPSLRSLTPARTHETLPGQRLSRAWSFPGGSIMLAIMLERVLGRKRSLATQLHVLPSHRFKGATCRAGTIVAPRPEVWTSNVRDRLAVLPVVRSSIVTVIR